MKKGLILITVALVIQYVSDFTFIYQSSRGEYLSGKIVDLLYLISYFALTTALIKYHTIHDNLSTVHSDNKESAT